MGLYVNRNENQTKLQERLSAELRERNKSRQVVPEEPETIDDTAYMRDLKDSTPINWLWVLLALLAIAIIGYFIYVLSR